MLIDHTQLTEPELAHLFPVRLLQVDVPSPAGGGGRTVFFLYRQLQGGWALGEVGGNARSGALFPQELVVHAVLDAQVDDAGARERFHAMVHETLGPAAMESGKLGFTELPWLPSPVELQLARDWVRPPLNPDFPRMTWAPIVQVARALGLVMSWAGGSPQARELAAWLGSRASASGGLTPLVLLPDEAKVWAFFLAEAAFSQQDGLPDALRLMRRKGAPALCALLDQEPLEQMVRWLALACASLDEPVPRCTVADVVHSSLALHADLLLEHWDASPLDALALGMT